MQTAFVKILPLVQNVFWNSPSRLYRQPPPVGSSTDCDLSEKAECESLDLGRGDGSAIAEGFVDQP
jgi:hypothetical protein